jgi:imidazolonepropionase
MEKNIIWDTLWIDVNLATFDDSQVPYGVIEDAAIAVQGDKIAWIGSQSDLKAPYTDLAHEVHSGNHGWIMPGFIDCHTHLIYAGNRSQEFELRLQGATYEALAEAGGGIRSTVLATRAMDEKTLFEQSAKRLKVLLSEGVTTIEIKSGYGLALESEEKMLRIARRLGEQFPVNVRTSFLGAHALPDEFLNAPDAYIPWLCDVLLPYLHEHHLVDAVDASCEHIAFSFEEVKQIFSKAKSLGLPVKLHADQLSDSKGALLAAEFQAFSADHLEYISEDSLKAMSNSGTVAVLLPASFYYLRETHVPPINLFRQYKIPIAIGSDSNPGTAPTLSLLTTLNMACILFRLTPEEVLRGVTVHAAKALGLQETHGTLTPGKIADFVLWDIERPAELTYWIGYNPVVHIVKSGKIVTPV